MDDRKRAGQCTPANQRRRNHYDVTDTVRICDPRDVLSCVRGILQRLDADLDTTPLARAFAIFGQLYAGLLPNYVGCDTQYHDAQHSLDCALAMARLIDGHERSAPAADRLGGERLLLGLIVALFHDAGYIRRADESTSHGAEHTLRHVRRSGDFLAALLPQLGFGESVPLIRQLVHFTGFEIALDRIDVVNRKDRMLGFLIGTADFLAQTADRCYPEKCRDFLFPEFVICGLAGNGSLVRDTPICRTADELLVNTPAFVEQFWRERLDGYFEGVYRYMDAHFGGSNPYLAEIQRNLRRLDTIGQPQAAPLNRRPRAICAASLRHLLSQKPGSGADLSLQ